MNDENLEISKELLDEFEQKGWKFVEKDKDNNFIFESKNRLQLVFVCKWKEYFIEDIEKKFIGAILLEDHILINKLFKYWGWL